MIDEDDPWPGLIALALLASNAAEATRAAKKLARLERYNSPEAKAARSERSRKAGATRKARREAEEQRLAEEFAREPTGPTCGSMGVVLQAQEVWCVLDPDEPHEDHEDVYGNRWPNDD